LALHIPPSHYVETKPKMLDKISNHASTPAHPDPLGPVAFSEVTGIRADRYPNYDHPTHSRPISWSLRARTAPAKALCADIVRRVEAFGGQGRQRDKLISGAEAFVGSLMLHAYSGCWSAQATGNDALKLVPIGGHRLNKIRKALLHANLIEVLPGYFDAEWGAGQSTKFRATRALLHLASAFDVQWRDAWHHFDWVSQRSPDVRREDAIHLRNLSGSQTTIRRGAEASRLVREVVEFNAFTRSFSLIYGPADDCRDITPQFRRIFTCDLGKHGRWYVVGGGYQAMAATPRYGNEEKHFRDYSRSSLRIDGEPCVELDVRASHLTIIHGLANVPLPAGGDPYALVDGVPRQVVKAWVSLRIGQGRSPSHWGREMAEDLLRKHGIQLGLYDIKSISGAIRAAMPFLGRELPDLLGINEQPKLCSHVLMGIEARALTTAMFALAKQGILGLPLHDALLVQDQHADQATKAIQASYQVEAGIIPLVRVKRGVEGA